jgi:hypothetical protein
VCDLGTSEGHPRPIPKPVQGFMHQLVMDGMRFPPKEDGYLLPSEEEIIEFNIEGMTTRADKYKVRRSNHSVWPRGKRSIYMPTDGVL